MAQSVPHGSTRHLVGISLTLCRHTGPMHGEHDRNSGRQAPLRRAHAVPWQRQWRYGCGGAHASIATRERECERVAWPTAPKLCGHPARRHSHTRTSFITAWLFEPSTDTHTERERAGRLWHGQRAPTACYHTGVPCVTQRHRHACAGAQRQAHTDGGALTRCQRQCRALRTWQRNQPHTPIDTIRVVSGCGRWLACHAALHFHLKAA